MEDQHTHKMLESLADLFLTGTGGMVASTKPKTADPEELNDQLDGPAPIRLTPKLVTGHPTPPHRSNSDAPRLRMTDADDEPTRDEPPSTGATIEAVFLGSLPGFAGPWLTQYAQWRATREGLVAVLHLDEQQIDMELVGHDGVLPAAPNVGDNLLATVEALPNVRLWLIHPASANGTLTQQLDAVERWTILCGAHELAVRGATELIRQLIEYDAEQSPSQADRNIGVMIMGSEGEAADAALQRISMTLDDVLDQPVQLLGALRQMAPVSVRIVGSFANPGDDWPQVLQAMSTVTARPLNGPTPPPPGTTGAGLPPFQATRRPQRMRPAPAQQPRPVEDVDIAPPPVAPQPTVAPSHAAAAAPTMPPQPVIPPIAAAQPPQAPPTTQTTANTAPANTNAPDLSTFLPGGLSLQARCPRHPQTQLVLDQDGRLHLLRQHIAANEALPAAVIDLIEARTWVSEHLNLLELTQRQCRFDASAEPVLHLFTDDAKSATALIARVGPFVKLHLLQRVHAGNEATWFCADLN